MYDLKTEV